MLKTVLRSGVSETKRRVQKLRYGRQVYSCGHWTAHAVYFGSVAFGLHEIYAIAGGVLLALLVIAPLFDGGAD